MTIGTNTFVSVNPFAGVLVENSNVPKNTSLRPAHPLICSFAA